MDYDFIRYLAAKKPIDDRSLNQAVYRALTRTLQRQKIPHTPLRVIEVGAGIGTMIERLLEWQLWQECRYTAVDRSAANLTEAVERLQRWAKIRQHACRTPDRRTVVLVNQNGTTTVKFRQADVYEFLRRSQGQKVWDLVVAHAFMDLVDLTEVLDLFCKIVRTGGWLYLTINFDGETILLPKVDPVFDRHVIDAYHRTMDERRIDGRPSGSSRTGRQLFEALNRCGASLIRAGGSDWVVHPVNDAYTPEESYFLHYILFTIYNALENQPDVDQRHLAYWQETRHRQVDQGKLVYVARQLDFLARVDSTNED
jgi:hypothetical protein